jgi:hypothetical protein
MERRRALAIAAATAATTVGAIAAVTANFGLLGFGAADSSPVGKLNAGRVAEVVDPATGPARAPELVVRYEDIYPPAGSQPAGVAPTPTRPSDEGATVPDPAPNGAGTESEGGHEREREHEHEAEHEDDD